MANTLLVRATTFAKDVAHAAATGLPAISAALHGTRLGAGPGFAAEAIERLGISLLPWPAQPIAKTLVRGGKEAALVIARRGNVLRANAKELTFHAREGIALTIKPGGSLAAGASAEAVRAISRSTARAALAGIGRAAMQGALAGGALEGALASFGAVRAVRAKKATVREAAFRVATSAARGALAGAVGVGAAGLVSAAVAFTGITLAGAPIVLPIATMLAASAVTSRAFDRYLPRLMAARNGGITIDVRPATA